MSPDSAAGTIAITGATGLLGGKLCTDLVRRGWRVRALSRRPVPQSLLEPSVVSFHCNLPDSIDVGALRGADVLVHCAYATRTTDRRSAWRVNVEGTRRLRARAREAGVRKFVFVSSVSARSDALSFYGRSKWDLEQELDPRTDLAIRPGLIVARSGGVFQRIVDSMRATTIIPAFGGGRQIAQTVHVDDLTTAFERAVKQDLSGVLVVAEPEGLPLVDLLRLMARRLGRRALIVPLPLTPSVVLLRACERAGLVLPVSSENLLGLAGLRHVECRQDLDRLGIRVRTAEESLDELLRSRLD